MFHVLIDFDLKTGRAVYAEVVEYDTSAAKYLLGLGYKGTDYPTIFLEDDGSSGCQVYGNYRDQEVAERVADGIVNAIRNGFISFTDYKG